MEDLLLLLLLAERAEVLLVTGGGFLAFGLDAVALEALAAFLDVDLVFRRKLPRSIPSSSSSARLW